MSPRNQLCREDLPAMAEMWFRNVFFPCSWEGKFLGDSPLLWKMVKGIFVDLLKPKPDSKPVHPREPAGLRGGEHRRLNHVSCSGSSAETRAAERACSLAICGTAQERQARAPLLKRGKQVAQAEHCAGALEPGTEGHSLTVSKPFCLQWRDLRSSPWPGGAAAWH